MIVKKLILVMLILAGFTVPAIASLAPGVPAPSQVWGKEYSNHIDEDAAGNLDPMQNIAWDGTGNAWDTFDYSTAFPWVQGTNVDALAYVKDKFFDEVVNDQVAMLAAIDQPTNPVPDNENIYYQTAGAGAVSGIWATGVIGSGPYTSDINTAAVNAHAQSVRPWINPDGLEVWGPEVAPPENGGQGTGDDAYLFSTNADWTYNAAVFTYLPGGGAGGQDTVVTYITAQQIQNAIETPEEVDLDAMMVYDIEGDGAFGAGDSIMFSVHETASAGGAFDGGEIWVWNFGSAAQFLVHGGVVWDTPHQVDITLGLQQGIEDIGGLEAVPEPATLGLFALGTLALLRRKKD